MNEIKGSHRQEWKDVLQAGVNKFLKHNL